MVNKSKIDAVIPDETDLVIQILDMDGEYDQIFVERDEDSFYEIFNDPGICRVIDAVAIDASGVRRPISSASGNVGRMAALGMVFHTDTGKNGLMLWSKVIGTAAELIFSNECDHCRRLENLVNSRLSDADVRIAVEAMYEAAFWVVMPLDSKLDQDHAEERFVLKGEARMLVGYETEFEKYFSDV